MSFYVEKCFAMLCEKQVSFLFTVVMDLRKLKKIYFLLS